VSKTCWFAKTSFGQSHVELLIDTGSAVSLINKKVYDRLANTSKGKLHPVVTRLSAADGEQIEVFGYSDFTLEIEGRTFEQSLIVASLGDIPGILGLDFLEKHESVLDVSRGILQFRKQKCEIWLHREKFDGCARVRVSESIIVPPNSQICVSGTVDGKWRDGTNGIVEPFKPFMDGNRLLMPKALVSLQQSSVTVALLNTSNEAIRVPVGTTVGELHKVDKISKRLDQPAPNKLDKSPKVVPNHLQSLIDGAKDNLSVEQLEQVSEVVAEYEDVFVGVDGKIGQTDLVTHSIDTGDARPVRLPARRLPIAKREAVGKELDKMLDEGIIEPSCSPWASPIVVVTRKDKTLRVCSDLRLVNMRTRKDAYPLPRIDDSLDALSGSNWFCTLDMACGFHQVKMEESSKEKTAIATHKGLFQFCSMPFGLCNAPATFERLMELVLRGLHWTNCLVFIDDVIVFGTDFETTLKNLSMVFDRLRDAGLKLKVKKCHLFQKQVAFLGHVVSGDGISCDPGKVEDVSNWSLPKDVSEVRSFLGLASYYRKFIPDFAKIADPLTRLTKKDTKFAWDEPCQKAFQILKTLLVSAPILAYPTRDDTFVLDTDASAFGIGAVLSQIQNGQERVISYASKTLTQSQRNYCTTHRELLAVVTFVRQFKHYLWGRKFLLRTDHSSLKWLCNFKEPEGMIARWLSILDTFDFDVEHRKGSLHCNADALSRKPPRRRCSCEECVDCRDRLLVGAVGKIRSNKVAPKSQPNPSPIPTRSRPNISHDSWLDCWSHSELRVMQSEDSDITFLIDFKIQGERPKRSSISMCSQNVKTLCSQWDMLVIENELLYRKVTKEGCESVLYQLVVPGTLRKQVLNLLHNNRTAAHLGKNKTLESVKQRFYWPGVTGDVIRWCKECKICAERKVGPGVGRFPMQHVEAHEPMEIIAIDIVGPCPMTSQGNEYIMVVGDYFSKWKEAYPISDHTALTVADKLVTEFICRLGAPKRIHTDQGREFESVLFAEVCRLLDVAKSRTTPYRPQSDGMVERFNRTLKQMLGMFVKEHRRDWDDHLPYVLMAYRASVHESTGCTPNLLMFGRELSLPIDVIVGPPPNPRPILCPSQYVEWLRESMFGAFKIAEKHLEVSVSRQKRNYDKSLKARKFAVGDWVWRWYPPLGNIKFGRKWRGPYLVVKVISDTTYTIQMKSDDKLVNVHVDNLKRLEGEPLTEGWVKANESPEDEEDNIGGDSESGSDVPCIPHSEISCADDPNIGHPFTSDDLAPDIPLDTEPAPTLIQTRSKRIIKPPQRYAP